GSQGVSCPCGNNGASGHGCANSVDPAGALLAATGTTNPDTVVLTCSGMPALAYCVFLKGDQGIAAVAFGDGLRCVHGNLIRLDLQLASQGAAQYPHPGDPPLSVRGQTPVGSGLSAHYQVYYRNAAAAFCPPDVFNVSNGWQITW